MSVIMLQVGLNGIKVRKQIAAKKMMRFTNCSKLHNIHIKKLTSLKLFHIFLNLFTWLQVSSLSFWHHFVEKHYYISISSSPELWATEKLYREECVSAGGLEGLRGL